MSQKSARIFLTKANEKYAIIFDSLRTYIQRSTQMYSDSTVCRFGGILIMIDNTVCFEM